MVSVCHVQGAVPSARSLRYEQVLLVSTAGCGHRLPLLLLQLDVILAACASGRLLLARRDVLLLNHLRML